MIAPSSADATGADDWKSYRCFRPNLEVEAVCPARTAVPDEVSITAAFGEWYVTVREGDGEPSVRSFIVEAFALSYAEGQRVRLGLEKIARV